MIEYNKEYFIEKFAAIPDELWIADAQLESENNDGCGCALYHCGVREKLVNNKLEYIFTEESDALSNLLHDNIDTIKSKDKELKKVLDKGYNKWAEKFELVYIINDTCLLLNKTPKQAIIDYLKCI